METGCTLCSDTRIITIPVQNISWTPTTERQKRVPARNYLLTKEAIYTPANQNYTPLKLEDFSLSVFIFKRLFGKYGSCPWGPLSLVPLDCYCSPPLGTSAVNECVREKAWWGFQGNMQLLSGFKSETPACWLCSFPSIWFGYLN